MKFYAYEGTFKLGKEPCGTIGKALWKDLKTVNGARNRCDVLWGRGRYRLYTYQSFYDTRTFREVT